MQENNPNFKDTDTGKSHSGGWFEKTLIGFTGTHSVRQALFRSGTRWAFSRPVFARDLMDVCGFSVEKHVIVKL